MAAIAYSVGRQSSYSQSGETPRQRRFGETKFLGQAPLRDLAILFNKLQDRDLSALGLAIFCEGTPLPCQE